MSQDTTREALASLLAALFYGQYATKEDKQNLDNSIKEALKDFDIGAGEFVASLADAPAVPVQPDDWAIEAVRSLLWDEHLECCGIPVVGADYMGQQEQVCCGCPEPSLLNDAQIVATLRAKFPETLAATPAAVQPTPEYDGVTTHPEFGAVQQGREALSFNKLMALADEAIHAYAAWLAESITGDLPSFHVERLNVAKDTAREKLRAALASTPQAPQPTAKMDTSQPWTAEHCRNYPRAAAALINELRAAASLLPAQAPAVPPKLWLWKNFVDGKPEYWAFDNPYPINLDDGDPQTLGEPCGYAIFKPSRTGRTDVSEEQVLRAIARAAAHERMSAEAMNASAPEGCGCADCAIDREACPRCYSAWWAKRHPNVEQLQGASTSEPAPADHYLWRSPSGERTINREVYECFSDIGKANCTPLPPPAPQAVQAQADWAPCNPACEDPAMRNKHCSATCRASAARTLASASDAAKQHPLQPVSDLTAAELDAETDRKLLEQALGALENSESEMRDLWFDHPSRKQNGAAIAALRVRLGKEIRNEG